MFASSRPAADRRSTGSTIGQLRRLAGATPSSRLPRRTVRLRLTVLYGCLFLLSGAGLLAITNLAVVRQSTSTAFYISRGNGNAQTHIQGVIGGFSAPVGIPPPAVLGQARVAIPAGAPPVAAKRLVPVTPQQLRAQARQLTTLAGKQRSTELNHLHITSAMALGIMAVISLALGWLISGRALRPLDEAFEAQRRFVANASHELRTPLAMMRTSLDVAVAKPGPTPPAMGALEAKLREGLDQADRLLESFLALARAQDGAPSERRPVALAGVLGAALGGHAKVAAERGIEISADIARDVELTGSETLVRRMFDNVIDNAIRHNEPGGWIRVATEAAGGGDGRVRVVIENGGRHLRADDLAELAQPFRRLGAERTGSQNGHGLGLSIVAAIADAHGGELDLQARAEGGLRVSIDLPRSSAPALAGPPSSAELPAGARK